MSFNNQLKFEEIKVCTHNSFRIDCNQGAVQEYKRRLVSDGRLFRRRVCCCKRPGRQQLVSRSHRKGTQPCEPGSCSGINRFLLLESSIGKGENSKENEEKIYKISIVLIRC